MFPPPKGHSTENLTASAARACRRSGRANQLVDVGERTAKVAIELAIEEVSTVVIGSCVRVNSGLVDQADRGVARLGDRSIAAGADLGEQGGTEGGALGGVEGVDVVAV